MFIFFKQMFIFPKHKLTVKTGGGGQILLSVSFYLFFYLYLCAVELVVGGLQKGTQGQCTSGRIGTCY